MTEYGAGFWAVLLVFLAIGIVVQVFFLMNLRDLLRQVQPANRAMQPNRVWLNFIPLFSLVWMFITIVKVRDSVRAEFQSRNWLAAGDFGFGVGIASAILVIAGETVNVLGASAGASDLTAWDGIAGAMSLAALVCWILYWVKTSTLKAQLTRYQAAAATASLGMYGPQTGSQEVGEQGVSELSSQVPGRSCGSCGRAAEPGDVFCRACGSRIETAVAEDGETEAQTDAASAPSPTPSGSCPFCGATYRPNALYCGTCGRPTV